MFVTVERLYGTWERRERKRDWQSINNIISWNAASVQVEDIRMYTESCWRMRCGREGVREGSGRSWTDQSKVYSVGTHWATPLNTDLEFNNKRQDCRIGTGCVCVWGGTCERREDEQWRLRWGNIVDGLYILIWSWLEKRIISFSLCRKWVMLQKV
jgi:hypothetical protein